MPLTPAHHHAWDLDAADARDLQLALAPRAELEDRFGEIGLVAGLDIGFEQAGRITRAAVAVLRLPDLALVESALARRPTGFPYVPGLLSFREIPAAVEALAALGSAPGLLLCDGQGLAHPRRFGLACHLGWLLDMPCIGVAGRLPPALLETAARIAQRLDALDGDIVAIQQQARLLQDEIDSRTAGRVNRHLYVLSVITSLFLPPSVIAGIFGMNLAGLPFTDSPSGFLLAMLVVAASPALVYLALWLSGALRR